MLPKSSKTRWKGGAPLFIGFFALALLIGGLGGWAVFARIAGAAIASGFLEVESEQQVVQHIEGGNVIEIFAKDGDIVASGDVLLRLDGTFIQSELDIVEGELFQIMALIARYEAERDGVTTYDIPQSFPDFKQNEAKLVELFERQRLVFASRLDTLQEIYEQFEIQNGQLLEQIEAAFIEKQSIETQLELHTQEVDDAKTLASRGLLPKKQLLLLLKQEASLRGQLGQSESKIVQQHSSISSLELRAIELKMRRRDEAISELRNLKSRVGELSKRRLLLIERLSRLDVRAPVDGAVFNSTIFSNEVVVQPGAPIMNIVPVDQPLVARTKLSTIDVDKVQLGQNANLIFAALDQKMTPKINGLVKKISADAFIDEASGISYYEVEIRPLDADLDNLHEQKLLPGMPVEAFIQTGDRSPLEYLVQPFADFFRRAFRE